MATITVEDTLGVSDIAGGVSSANAQTPMQMLCDICPIEKSIHWVCWLYGGLYWLIVDFPNWLVDTLGWPLGAIIAGILFIIVIIVLILVGLILTEVAAVLKPIEMIHKEPLIRGIVYTVIGILMLGHHLDIIPWPIAGLIIGVLAFFDGLGIFSTGLFEFFPSNVLGINIWIGIGWTVFMVLVATIQMGMLLPFGLALFALGPVFGLPWDWFEDTFNILLGVGLLVFVILCFYPSIVPGAETVLKIFDYILFKLNLYNMPCK